MAIRSRTAARAPRGAVHPSAGRCDTAPTLAALVVLTLLGAIAPGGCAGPGGGGARGTNRPMVARSAAESGVFEPVGASPVLRFYDELETRGLACHDDALESVLLLTAGVGASTYDERVRRATELGLLAPGFSRPAREAVTVGEVSVLIARAEQPGREIDPQAAVDVLVASGALPSTIRPNQGITGAQLLSVIGHAADARRESGTAPASPMTPPAATPAPAPTDGPEPLPASLPAGQPTP